MSKMLETPSHQIEYKNDDLESEDATLEFMEEITWGNSVKMNADGEAIDMFPSELNNVETRMETLDSIVKSVLDKFVQRSLVGKKKYNTDLDRTDLTIVEWVQHTQEELMDATLYLEKLKQTLIEKGLDATCK